LRRTKYDLSINTFPQSRRAYRLVAKMVNAKTRLSHEYAGFGPLDRWLTQKTIPQDYSRHAVENNLSLLSLIGVKPVWPQHAYEVFLADAEKVAAENFIAGEQMASRPLLGIHVGSGGTKNLALRRWPLANYVELARRLRQKRPELGILFFGGPEEKLAHEKVKAALDDPQVFFPETQNIRQTAALIGKCRLFLSVDTSLMHLAAAMKVKEQFVIETPTWNKPIEPYGQPFTLIKNPAVAGRNLEFYRYDGRGIRGTPAELERCMNSVQVDDVLAPIEQALSKSI
jgi:ADP-heptose:LPS heptosyltransferase